MTLIAGFKCADGGVICADSQETVKQNGEEFRVMRKKLASVSVGDCELSLAGAGNGPIVDLFVSRLRKTGKKASVPTLDALADWLHEEMKKFLKEQRIRISKCDAAIQCVIGARSKTQNNYALWVTSRGDVSPIEDQKLIGFCDHQYEHAVDSYYRPDISIAQGIFLGLFVMSLAEQTSNYVKRPVSVVVIRDGGIYPQPKELITELHNRVQLFASHFERLFLACPDTGLQHGEFADKLNEFMKSIVHLRREYVEEMVGKKIEEGLDKVNDPYILMPVGTTFVINPTQPQAESLRKTYEDMAKNLRETVAHVQDRERIIENLESLKGFYKKLLLQAKGGEAPTQEEQQVMGQAAQEIVHAALMGPYKVEQEVHQRLVCVMNVIPADTALGELVYPRMHQANNLVRLGIVEQALAYMQRPMPPSTPEMSEGPQ